MILATLLVSCAPQAAGQLLQGTSTDHQRCIGLDARDGWVAASWLSPTSATPDSTFIWSEQPGTDGLTVETTLDGIFGNCALGPDGMVVTTGATGATAHFPGAGGGAWSSEPITPTVQWARSYGESIDIEGRRMAISSETFSGPDEFVVSVFDLPVGSNTWVLIDQIREPRRSSAGANYVRLDVEGDDLLIGTRTTGGSDAGSVLVYRLTGGTYQFTQSLDRSVIFGGSFGQEVTADAGRALVAGVRNNNTGFIAAFERDGAGVWQETQLFNDPNWQPSDRFGRNMEMVGTFALIGARSLSAPGNALGQSLLYQLDPANGRWGQVLAHRDAGAQAADWFADHVALDTTNGAVRTVTSGTINSQGFAWAHDVADWSAPVLDLRSPFGSSYCEQPTSSTGHDPVLRAVGSTSVSSDDFRLRVEGMPPATPILIVGATEAAAAPIGPFGVVCATSGLFRMPPLLVTGANGVATLTVDLSALPTNPVPTAVVPGTSWYFQGIYRDQGVGATNSLGVTFR